MTTVDYGALTICKKKSCGHTVTSSVQIMQWTKHFFPPPIDELQKNSAVQRMIQETYTVCFIDKIVSILQKVPGINMYVFFLKNYQWISLLEFYLITFEVKSHLLLNWPKTLLSITKPSWHYRSLIIVWVHWTQLHPQILTKP